MISFHTARQGVAARMGSRAARLKPHDVAAARKYIATWWAQATRFHPSDDETLLGLPKPYIVPSFVPSSGFDYDELYYWDCFFIAQGLLDDGHRDLAIGMLEDLLALVTRFKTVPNASRTYLMGRSQPPLLTSFIFDLYEAFHLSDEWLQTAIKLAETEYQTAWMGTKKPNYRQIYRGLSRYYDVNMLHDLAEAESGWDMTPRFYRHALNFVPVDLNALLYKYEADFAKAARLRHDQKAAVAWFGKAEARARVMNELMWDGIRGLYFDYDYTRNRRSHVASLAAYYPMWVGMVSERQAASLVHALRQFEHRGGLAATDALLVRDRIHDSLPMQWAYPNGWAPLHLIVVQALERYGYHQDAERIALKWLDTNLRWFNAHGEFIEKYNVVRPQKPPAPGVYPSQTGFGWTNAVFERFCRDYLDAA